LHRRYCLSERARMQANCRASAAADAGTPRSQTLFANAPLLIVILSLVKDL